MTCCFCCLLFDSFEFFQCIYVLCSLSLSLSLGMSPCIKLLTQNWMFLYFCWQLPALQDDGPASDSYGKFSSRDRNNRRGSRDRGGYSSGSRDRGGFSSGSRDRGGFRTSQGWGSGRGSDSDDGLFMSSGRSFRTDNSWSRSPKSSGDDWLIGGRTSNRSLSRDRYISLKNFSLCEFLKEHIFLFETTLKVLRRRGGGVGLWGKCKEHFAQQFYCLKWIIFLHKISCYFYTVCKLLLHGYIL